MRFLLRYQSAPRPKTLTSAPVIIQPRVVVVTGIAVLFVWVFVIGVMILR